MEKKKVSLSSKMTSGMSEEDTKQFKLMFSNCHFVRDKISEAVDNYVEKATKEMTSDKSFESPAWSQKQAYNLGLLDAYSTCLKLLSENK